MRKCKCKLPAIKDTYIISYDDIEKMCFFSNDFKIVITEIKLKKERHYKKGILNITL
jgi:hypothetical protein